MNACIVMDGCKGSVCGEGGQEGWGLVVRACVLRYALKPYRAPHVRPVLTSTILIAKELSCNLNFINPVKKKGLWSVATFVYKSFVRG